MSTTRLRILLALGLLAGIYFLYSFLMGKKYPRHNWTLTLNEKGDGPYDLSVFSAFLEKESGGNLDVNPYKALRFLKLNPAKAALYVYIGEQAPHYPEADAAALIKYLRDGGQAFFACPALGNSLSSLLLTEEARESITLAAVQEPALQVAAGDSGLRLGFYDEPDGPPRLLYHADADTLHRERTASIPFFLMNPEWSYLTGPAELMGYVGNRPGLIRLKVGKGYLFWQSTPLPFTNYFLLREEMQDYSSRLIFCFKKGSTPQAGFPVIFDKAPRKNFPEESEEESNPSILSYFISRPAFRIVWYGIVLGGLAAMVFLARRRQRIIPYVPPKTNGSLHFIRAIADLYLRKKSHYYMCQLKMKLFLNHVRNRYGLTIQQLDEEGLALLARRSGVPVALLQEIFRTWNAIQNISRQRTTSGDLTRFHSLTESFYQQSR